MNITFPTNTKEIIDEIRGAIGRDITIYTIASGGDCPTCRRDPLTGKSIDPYCPTCSGEGYLYTMSGTTASAHITWESINTSIYHPGGHVDVGECLVSMEYSEDLLEVVKDSKYFVVDSREMYAIDYDTRGVPELNRILVNLQEDPLK